MRRTTAALLLAFCLPLVLARADEVVLTGGSTISGVLLEEDVQGVRLLLPRGDEIRLRPEDVREVARDPDAPADGTFMRYREPDDTGGGLEIAVTYFVSPEGGPRIDLVGAAHIADASFYALVQQLLDRADVVLYEGVKPEGATPEEFQRTAAKGVNPIRELQTKLAGWFGLVVQMDAVDYRRAHFVHADLTAEEFLGREAPAEGDADAPGGEATDVDQADLPAPLRNTIKQDKAIKPLLDAMLGRPGPFRAQVKMMLARIMGSADVQGLLTVMMPGLSDLLLTKRNAVVIERLRERIGEADGSIAVFYGAAHMQGIQKLLEEELGYRRAGGKWLRAWEMGSLK